VPELYLVPDSHTIGEHRASEYQIDRCECQGKSIYLAHQRLVLWDMVALM
jgi:hypothetical protein